MNLNNMLFFVALALLAGCKTDNSNFAQMPEKDFFARYLYQDSGIMYFECENFADVSLEKYNISELNRMFGSNPGNIRSKEAVQNIHDHAVTDTIYTFSYGHNIVQVYKTAENDEFIFTFDVADPRFSLANAIHTGMNKKTFAGMFHITGNITDFVIIRNEESTISFLFYFKQDLLYRINSYLYLD